MEAPHALRLSDLCCAEFHKPSKGALARLELKSFALNILESLTMPRSLLCAYTSPSQEETGNAASK